MSDDVRTHVVMTDPDLSRTLRRMAEETATVVTSVLSQPQPTTNEQLWATQYLTQFAERVASAVRQELAPYLQHKAGCGTMCVECGRPEVSLSHRKHWKPGCGVFWHDFTPKGDCTCGLDKRLAALKESR